MTKPVSLARRCDVHGCGYTAGIGVSRCFRHRAATAPLSTAWPLWLEIPPVHTIVHIVAMSHMHVDEKVFAVLPRGLFAIIVTQKEKDSALRVLTLPAGIEELEHFDEWSWDAHFPCQVSPTFDKYGNHMTLEIVPEPIADGVRAFVCLTGVIIDVDELNIGEPVRVEAGWMAG